jgi:basic membrane lipoprotein Med (substrate-binding protein (PBP1-ABC) superfamily)
MSKKLYLILGVILVASLVLSACQKAAPTEPQLLLPRSSDRRSPPLAHRGSTERRSSKVCQVTDTGGIDDKSFNATVKGC